LRAGGIKTAICTNKPAPVTTVAVRALGLEPLMDHVLGASEAIRKKPHADMLLHICGALGCKPADTVMVGDSIADHGVARAAGAPVILVDFGYAKEPVTGMGADAVVSHLSEIPAALERLAARR
jgi:phosphoglycolate phosphatase